MKKGIRGHDIRADGIENLSLLAQEYGIEYLQLVLEKSVDGFKTGDYTEEYAISLKNQLKGTKIAVLGSYINPSNPNDMELKADIEKFNHYNARYGQAQKVVNMALKYLYCCDNIDEQTRIKFDPCHMPLDQYTLAWYFLQGRNLFLEWSYLNQKQYETISIDIRTILGNDVLRAELVIWEGMKSKIVVLKPR